MRPDNPACYECPKGTQELHTWKRLPDGTAICVKCDVQLTVEQAVDCFHEHH